MDRSFSSGGKCGFVKLGRRWSKTLHAGRVPVIVAFSGYMNEWIVACAVMDKFLRMSGELGVG